MHVELSATVKWKLINAFKADILSHKKTFRRFALETLGVYEYELLLAMIDIKGIEYLDVYDALYCLFRRAQN